jgi:beta-galactosidase GanA
MHSHLPEIKPVGKKWLLHVDGKPMLILSGHVMNSSSFDPAWMESVWPRMKAFHLNTLMVPISWQAVELVEGEFDFSLVDSLIRQAREQGMRLVFAWFGTWKNGRSFYVPPWVIKDMTRFPRMETGSGQRLEVLSFLGSETLAADTRAFVAFMNHLKEVDAKHNTVLMVQIQNEVGLLGDTRDRSPAAEAAFASQVPAELMDYLANHKDRLKPHLLEVWGKQSNRSKGTWSEVFGPGVETDEIFMAWHYARFIDQMAEAATAVYGLPFFVNGWLGQVPNPVPGQIPSGGPVARMMDIWKAGGPHLAMLAPDTYAFYSERMADFSREDNPLFVPEACALWLGDTGSAPAKAFYTFAEAQGLGFAPFAIDHSLYDQDHPIGVAYAALENLSPLMMKNFGTDRMRGFFKEEEAQTETALAIGPYQFHISYQPLLEQCYGLIIRSGENEFVLAGNGARIRFAAADPEKHSGLSVVLVEEGKFGAHGEFVRQRLVGGDEVMGTVGIKLPAHGYDLEQHPSNMTILRVQLFLHPPREDGAAQQTDETPEF